MPSRATVNISSSPSRSDEAALRSRAISSASAVSVCLTNRREIAERLVDFASLSTTVPTGSPTRACRRVATPASIRSITTRVSASSAAKWL
ncbi:Uncharacterised protein [Mycobacteroides abscessus subsp. abscessus]|nr:Uncharacterised protein [Mycobacteroides abscessus subsp. abscessus]SHY74643.1 Uncharacterised protein [Mycobacteroides abscessus subsp. abscessus]SIE40874.1 Uncharacterised protein [Mycobacteroides abscessus subsp. abscessus]